MYTKDDIEGMLSQFGVENDDFLMVHCSDRAANEMDGGVTALIDALRDYISEGTLIAPACQRGDCGDGSSAPFDPTSAPISDIFGRALMDLPGAMRTLHPTCSFAVYGTRADWFIRDEHLCPSPFLRAGCMGKLLDCRGKLLFIDTDLSECALLHAIEEWSGAENRIGEPHFQYYIMYDGSLFMGNASDLLPGARAAEEFYPKAEKPLISLKAAMEFDLHGTRCLMCDCAAMVRIISELLILDPALFEDKSAVSRSFIKIIRASLKEH